MYGVRKREKRGANKLRTGQGNAAVPLMKRSGQEVIGVPGKDRSESKQISEYPPLHQLFKINADHQHDAENTDRYSNHHELCYRPFKQHLFNNNGKGRHKGQNNRYQRNGDVIHGCIFAEEIKDLPADGAQNKKGNILFAHKTLSVGFQFDAGHHNHADRVFKKQKAQRLQNGQHMLGHHIIKTPGNDQTAHHQIRVKLRSVSSFLFTFFNLNLFFLTHVSPVPQFPYFSLYALPLLL